MPSINFNRSSENDLVYNPTINAYSPKNLYAWTVDDANENKITPSSYRTLYTSLQNLSDVQDFYSIKFYNSSGEEINVHNIYHEDDPLDDIYNVDNEKVQLRFDM